MASRKEEKERLRREREERERQELDKQAARSRRMRLGGALAAVAVIGAVVALVAAGGGDDSAQANKGLQETAGPWEPVSDGLEDRENALKLPAPSETIYHVHAQVKVFANGKEMPVPSNIGITEGFLSSLHTHDEKGVVHMEAVEPYPFTVRQFFTVWGVKLTPTQLGSYRAGNGLAVEVYANGEKAPKGIDFEMKQGDVVVVSFGKPGSAPKTFKPEPAVGV